MLISFQRFANVKLLIRANHTALNFTLAAVLKSSKLVKLTQRARFVAINCFLMIEVIKPSLVFGFRLLKVNTLFTGCQLPPRKRRTNGSSVSRIPSLTIPSTRFSYSVRRRPSLIVSKLQVETRRLG